MIRCAMVAHLSEVSGAGVALLDTVRQLDPRRFSCTLVLPGAGPLAARAQGMGVEPVVVANAEVSLEAAGGLWARLRLLAGRGGYVLRLARMLRAGKFDLAYINSTSTVFAGLAAALAGVPVVWHVHETVENPPGRKLRVKLWMIEHLSRGLLYASQTGVEAFPASSVSRKLVVRNWVDVERLQAARRSEEMRRSWGAATDDVVVLANGLFARKGADVLLEAAAAALGEGVPLRVVLTGVAPDESAAFAEELRRRSEVAPLKGHVHFTGLVTDMPTALASADLYVSASRNEALPILVVEALVCGTPVICTDVGDCALLLRGGRRGALVKPGDAAALAAILIYEARNRESQAPMLERVRAEVAQEYGGKDFRAPLETFLAETIGETSG